jgi:hypothetical protein
VRVRDGSNYRETATCERRGGTSDAAPSDMNLFHLYEVLMVLATVASVIVFFAIQASPELRTGTPGPHRMNPLY